MGFCILCAKVLRFLCRRMTFYYANHQLEIECRVTAMPKDVSKQ